METPHNSEHCFESSMINLIEGMFALSCCQTQEPLDLGDYQQVLDSGALECFESATGGSRFLACLALHLLHLQRLQRLQPQNTFPVQTRAYEQTKNTQIARNDSPLMIRFQTFWVSIAIENCMGISLFVDHQIHPFGFLYPWRANRLARWFFLVHQIPEFGSRWVCLMRDPIIFSCINIVKLLDFGPFLTTQRQDFLDGCDKGSAIGCTIALRSRSANTASTPVGG